MDFIKKAWLTFRQLKTWLQIVIVLVLISLFGAIGGSGSTSTDSGTNATLSNPNATPSKKETPQVTASAKPAVSESEFKAAMSHMRKMKDTVENSEYFRDTTSPKFVNQNAFDIYAGGTPGQVPTLFLRIQYEGSDWLFIKSYFFNVDGFTYEITPDYGVIKTDNNTRVWEWYNEAMTSAQVDLVQRIANSKSAVMRLNGTQYHKDVTITATQKSAIKNVLTVFQGLGGDLKNP